MNDAQHLTMIADDSLVYTITRRPEATTTRLYLEFPGIGYDDLWVHHPPGMSLTILDSPTYARLSDELRKLREFDDRIRHSWVIRALIYLRILR